MDDVESFEQLDIWQVLELIEQDERGTMRTIEITRQGASRRSDPRFELEVPDRIDADEARDEIRDGTVPVWAYKQLLAGGWPVAGWELA